MKERQVILGLKSPGKFSIEERKIIIEEYLSSGRTKVDIWEKYTGQTKEHGSLLSWMRQLGYEDVPKRDILGINKALNMSNEQRSSSIEIIQLKEKIAQLEKALVHSELRSAAMETMIEVAEKELKINIRKKSSTKQSTK